MYNINKELLIKTLNLNIKEITSINKNTVKYIIEGTDKEESLNIFELGNLVKKYVLNKGYMMTSSIGFRIDNSPEIASCNLFGDKKTDYSNSVLEMQTIFDGAIQTINFNSTFDIIKFYEGKNYEISTELLSKSLNINVVEVIDSSSKNIKYLTKEGNEDIINVFELANIIKIYCHKNKYVLNSSIESRKNEEGFYSGYCQTYKTGQFGSKFFNSKTEEQSVIFAGEWLLENVVEENSTLLVSA